MFARFWNSAIVLALAGSMSTTGCATLMEERTESVKVLVPPGRHQVFYEGKRVFDGETVTVRKRAETPALEVDYGSYRVAQKMEYDPDPWLIGDAVLLIPFIVPGVVAFIVDFASGAWRDLEQEQKVIPASVIGTAEEPEPRRIRRRDDDTNYAPTPEELQGEIGPTPRPRTKSSEPVKSVEPKTDSAKDAAPKQTAPEEAAPQVEEPEAREEPPLQTHPIQP